jgi:hypothetical protein
MCVLLLVGCQEELLTGSGRVESFTYTVTNISPSQAESFATYTVQTEKANYFIAGKVLFTEPRNKFNINDTVFFIPMKPKEYRQYRNKIK